MEKVRIGVIGLGQRGYSITKGVLMRMDDAVVTAVCDFYQDRVDRAVDIIKEKKGNIPFGTTDYKELLKRDDVDAVYVACSWEYHTPVAIDALHAGKAVAMEVGGAYSTEELFDLVKAQEETGTPFMFMENCCFNRKELLVTNLARHGIFGEIVHSSGSYTHDIREEIASGNIIRHYRLRNYTQRNCENYPTHELGPIAKLLNINRGNRMVSLVSVASKAKGLEQFIKDRPDLVEKDPTLKGRRFAQGDIVHTIITCANGETILLKLDTSLPSKGSREWVVRGTKGGYTEYINAVHLDDGNYEEGYRSFAENNTDNVTKYEQDYLHPMWLNMTEEQKASGHGGMDYFEFRSFIETLKAGKEMPVDVYDAAAWMAITALSEESVAEGGMPKAIPDFTGGKWLLREPMDVVEFPKVTK